LNAEKAGAKIAIITDSKSNGDEFIDMVIMVFILFNRDPVDIRWYKEKKSNPCCFPSWGFRKTFERVFNIRKSNSLHYNTVKFYHEVIERQLHY
jgi:hypothetical protein